MSCPSTLPPPRVRFAPSFFLRLSDISFDRGRHDALNVDCGDQEGQPPFRLASSPLSNRAFLRTGIAYQYVNQATSLRRREWAGLCFSTTKLQTFETRSSLLSTLLTTTSSAGPTLSLLTGSEATRCIYIFSARAREAKNRVNRIQTTRSCRSPGLHFPLRYPFRIGPSLPLVVKLSSESGASCLNFCFARLERGSVTPLSSTSV